MALDRVPEFSPGAGLQPLGPNHAGAHFRTCKKTHRAWNGSIPARFESVGASLVSI